MVKSLLQADFSPASKVPANISLAVLLSTASRMTPSSRVPLLSVARKLYLPLTSHQTTRATNSPSLMPAKPKTRSSLMTSGAGISRSRFKGRHTSGRTGKCSSRLCQIQLKAVRETTVVRTGKAVTRGTELRASH